MWTEVSFFEYLHPIISYTKQETDDVEYILLKKQSDLGFILKDVQENGEFTIRTIPVSKKDKAELESFIKGKDFFKDAKFKGSKIFASVNDIPGTDWILLAKIDQEKFRYLQRMLLYLSLLFLYSLSFYLQVLRMLSGNEADCIS